MDLYPAIDLRGGQVVRLAQGDYARETVYGRDPAAVAAAYEAAGAAWVHVVDLDAARGQGDDNRTLVKAVAAAVDVPVQAGGGIRTDADAVAGLAAGVARLVIGTAAFRSPGFVARLCAEHPGAVAVDVAVSDGRVVVQGWQETGDERLEEALERFSSDGVAAFVVTEVGRDGMLAGPDLDVMRAALAATERPVIASGGVASLDDLRALRDLGLAGAIVGRALYEGRFAVAEAVEAAR